MEQNRIEREYPEKGIFYYNWGDPRELVYGEIPEEKAVNPETVILKPDYLLIKVKAISINPIDWKILSGRQKVVTGRNFPRIFGSDFSGEVCRVGKSAEKYGFVPGDRVMGMVSPLRGGSGRLWLTVKAGHCIKIPRNMKYSEAASFSAAGISAILATAFTEKRNPGKALVFGAGGGVGSLVLQILSEKGWDITAVARPEQQEFLKNLGCGSFLDRKTWQDNLEGKWDAVVDGPAAVIRKSPSRFLLRGGCYYPVYIPDSFIPSQILRIILWIFSPWSTGLFLAYPSVRRVRSLERLIQRGILKPVIDSEFEGKNCRKAVLKSVRGGVNGKIIINLD